MKRLLLLLITIHSLCLLSACGGGGGNGGASGGGGGQSIQIAVVTQGGLQAIDVTQTLTITATATPATNNTDFDWTLSCGGGACGSITSQTASSAPATFTAPGVAPTSSVTITATLSGRAMSSSTTVTVTSAPTVTTAGAITAATLGSPYSFQLAASGGAGTMLWALGGGTTLPDSLSLSGTGMISGTPSGAGGNFNFKVHVTDSGNPPQTSPDVSLSISIGGTATTHFSVTAPANATVGTAFNFSVTALDASDNAAPGYSGTVHFTSIDSQADLPADSMLTNGTANFPAALKTVGEQTIIATDTVTPSITGTSNSIIVGATSAANPVPLINQPLSPAAMLPGGPGFTLTVNGTGFVSGSVVTWNSSSRTTDFVSESKLTATILAADIASFDTASVTVVNPGPGGGTSNVDFFETTKPTSSVALGTPASLNAGSSPSYVATGDFDGDGKLDLIIANSGSNDISVLLGNGDGTFQAAVNYGAGSGPRSIGVGDFNRDGKLDLAVVNTNSKNVSVLLGNGDGTFKPAVNYAAGSGGQSVAIGDLNGDGKLDLVVANNQSNNVTVLLGNGDGTFQAALSYPAGSGASSVAVGDFNGDGNLDLAVTNFGTGTVSILLGNGDGTFQPALDTTVGTNPIAIALGDLNDDGKLDLAVANNGSSNVSILLGNGDGTFQTAVDFAVGTNPNAVALADFNGDGKLDLAVANDSEGNVSILVGNGDGTFQPAVNYDAGAVSQSVAAGDFNGDGRLDLAVTNGASATVSVLLQPGLASGPNATWSFPELTFASQVVRTVSPAQSVMLINYGTATLNITSITASANFGETNICASSIAPGASCPVLVTFSPSTEGTLNGTLAVTDNAAGSPQTVALTGKCIGAGCIPPGGECFGPGPNLCCPAPRGHHSFCSNPTGSGTCVED